MDNEKYSSDIDKSLEEFKRQTMAELESMEKVISHNEKIKEEIEQTAIQNNMEAEGEVKSNKLSSVVFITVLIAIMLCSFVSIKYLKPMNEYRKAIATMESGHYEAAIDMFRKLESYKNSPEMINECIYLKADNLMKNGKTALALVEYSRIKDYKDSSHKINEYIGTELADGIIAVGGNHSLGLNSIGRVLSTGDNTYGQCETGDLSDITAVSAGENHTLALCADGSVKALGDNTYGQCDVEAWSNITYINAWGNTSFGVREDGSVVVTGEDVLGNTEIEDFTDIKKLACGRGFTLGLKNDGTIAVAGDKDMFEDTGTWTDVKDISACGTTVAALTNKGIVLACGNVANDSYKQWTDIKCVSAGNSYILAINSAGDALSTTDLGQNFKIALDGSIKIECGLNHLLVLKSTGTLVAIGKNNVGECDVKNWRDIMIK